MTVLKVSSQTKLIDYLRYYQDPIMVSFIYLSWMALKQMEMLVNTGAFRFNLVTTGEPLVVALLFYGLKKLALFIRSNLEIENLRREENESR